MDEQANMGNVQRKPGGWVDPWLARVRALHTEAQLRRDYMTNQIPEADSWYCLDRVLWRETYPDGGRR
jgi:hypothetical protein